MILCLVDIVTTWIGLSMGAVEANKLIEPIIMTWEGILLKITITALIGFYLDYRHAKRTIILVNILMALVCLSNTITVMLLLLVN